MSDNNNQNQGLVNCADVIGKLPFWTRVVYFSLAGTWILELFTGFPSYFIASSVTTTFSKFFLWNIFTSCFYVDSLLFLGIIIYNFNTFLPKLEQRFSSLVIMTKFIVNSAIIVLITLLIQYLLSYETYPSNGVEGIWFNMLFKYCYFNSETEMKFCCFNWKFKKTLYPYLLLAICAFLKFSIPVEMIVGLMMALLEIKMENYCGILFGKGVFNKISSFVNLTSVKCWIQYIQDRQPANFMNKTMYENLQNYQFEGVGSGEAMQKTVSDPFSKKGVRIGDY